MKIVQSCAQTGCSWLPKGQSREYSEEEIYPNGMCPWFYFSAYPYMLGLLFGADFMHNSDGDANVACPAKNGCRALVKKREHPGSFDDPRISPETHFVIYTEVVDVGDCPAGHEVGERFLFPTCLKEHFLCPAAWYQAFTFISKRLPVPECLDHNAIGCPDWSRPDMIVGIENNGMDDGS